MEWEMEPSRVGENTALPLKVDKFSSASESIGKKTTHETTKRGWCGVFEYSSKYQKYVTVLISIIWGRGYKIFYWW